MKARYLIVIVAIALLAVPAVAQEVMRVTGGNVGIGTSTPTRKLHVVDTATGTGPVIEIVRAGSPQVFYSNSVTGDQWQLSQLGLQFTASALGTGGAEFTVFKNGRVRMGPGPNTYFELTPTGNLIIKGTVTANGVVLSSSSELKESKGRVNAQSVLEKVAALPIHSWTFKEGDRSLHIGPFAEDFYGAFGVGPDAQHIAMIDSAGVALAAIKGLNEKVEQLEKANAELRAAIELLSAGK